MPPRTDDLDQSHQQAVARSQRGGAKTGRGGLGKAVSDGGRRGAAVARGAHCDKASSHGSDVAADEQKEKRSRTRDEIYKGISIVAAENPTLSKTDFDGRVLQYLHAIHGVGGMEAVNKALVLIHESTVNKTRGQIGNWPAYLATLLKKYHNDAKEAARLSAGSSGSRPSGGDAAAGKLAAEEAPAAPNAVREAVRPRHGEESTKCCRRTLRSTFEVPAGVHAGQLMNAADGQFICRICLDVCEEPAVLPCSHLFCRECLKQLMDWSADKVNAKCVQQVHCPACRAPFTNTQAVPEEHAIARQLIGRIQICCAFADPSRLPDRDDDPLPEGHAARTHHLRCDWVGTVAAYAAHLELNCEVACRLREMQSGVSAPGVVAQAQLSPQAAAGCSGAARLAPGPPQQQARQPQLGLLVPSQAGDRWQPGSALLGGSPALGSSEVVARRRPGERSGLPPAPATAAVGRGIRVVGPTPSSGSAESPTSNEVSTYALSDATTPSRLTAASSSTPSGSTPSPAPRSAERAEGLAGIVGVFATSRAYAPQDGADGQQLALEVGDRVAVYQHEKRGWAYGAKLRDDGALAGPRGWFPSWAVEVDA